MDWLKHLPGPVKDLLPYLSPRALQVVDLPAMTGAVGRLSRQWVLGTGVREAQRALALCLPPAVVLGPVRGALAVGELSVEARKQVGEQLLHLYFRQIFSEAPLFFDLRPARLAWEGSRLTWEATKAFYVLDPAFRRSLQGMYRGYYEGDLGLLKRSLRELRLVAPNASADEESQITDLLMRHFSGGRDGPVRFSTETFKESFDSLFGLVLAGGNRLAPDFAFLGLLLASLYVSLEALGGEFEVSDLFRAATNSASLRRD